jgi:hypothetical protein
VSLSHAERGRLGGHAAHAAMSPEERRAFAQKGHLAQAVKAVVDKAPALTDDQKACLRAILHAEAPGGETP